MCSKRYGRVWYGFSPCNRRSRFFGKACHEMRRSPGVKLTQLTCTPCTTIALCDVTFEYLRARCCLVKDFRCMYTQVISTFESTSFDFIHTLSKLCLYCTVGCSKLCLYCENTSIELVLHRMCLMWYTLQFYAAKHLRRAISNSGTTTCGVRSRKRFYERRRGTCVRQR